MKKTNDIPTEIKCSNCGLTQTEISKITFIQVDKFDLWCSICISKFQKKEKEDRISFRQNALKEKDEEMEAWKRVFINRSKGN